MTPTVLSCFSGIGGLDLGLEAAGFKTIGCLETDGDARVALHRNRENWRELGDGDVVSASEWLSPDSLGISRGELTAIAGGPPCQPFSKAAQWAAPKRGVRDDRGQTVIGMMNLVGKFLPRVVIMENVAGFLSGENNATSIINREFEKINRNSGTSYALQSWIVNAADFGVAQQRKRAIVLAFREPTRLPSQLPVPQLGTVRTAWDAIGHLEDKADRNVVAMGKYADLLPSIPEGSNYQYLTAQGGGAELELFGYRTRYWSFLLKLARDKPAWTLPASPGPSTGPFHWANRPLTSQERLLLQGFPESWKLVANERTNVRLTGNATPPPLAEAIGRFALAQLAQPASPVNTATLPTLATAKSQTRMPPAQPPAKLPPHWHAKVAPHDKHPGRGAGPAGYFVNPRRSSGDEIAS